jgi:hypothetical protein
VSEGATLFSLLEDIRIVKSTQQGVCVCVTLSIALPFTVRSILMQKKSYENSNISHIQKKKIII